MSETHLSPSEEMEVESHAPYGKVWLGLLVFTLLEYFYAMLMADSFTTLVIGLMFLATIKAGMVGWYFMHLKYEGNWVYAFLVPAGILATIVVLALVPDIAMRIGAEDPSEVEDLTSTMLSAPLIPGSIRG